MKKKKKGVVSEAVKTKTYDNTDSFGCFCKRILFQSKGRAERFHNFPAPSMVVG
jgi:hypothetical protein